MSNYIIAPEARADLDEIWDYYAVELENPEAGDRIRDELFDAMRLLARTPGMGHFRSDLAKEPLRFWRVRKILIIYRCETSPIEVVRVLHGGRDVAAVLDD